mgnify:FL=1
MIRVLIADDSAFMRKVLSDLFVKQADFEVVGTAMNGKDAITKVKKLKPDLLTMDVNMPVMDGLNALAVIMEECPIPVIMISSLTHEGTEATIRALSLGAIDFISKTGGSISRIDTIEDEILTKCRNAAKANVHKIIRNGAKIATPIAPARPAIKHVELPIRHGYKPLEKKTIVTSSKPSKAALFTKPSNPLLSQKQHKLVPKPATPAASGSPGKKLVAIGTSTGGPQALQNVITRLPADLPCGVVVVQHMPPGFTKALADRLNSISKVTVKEAEDDDVIKAGHVYIAPGSYHMRIKDEGALRRIKLGQDPPVGNHRPAVNVMYDSVASLGSKLVAVIMTGMGCDGLDGMKKIKAAGGFSIAQDEATCVVYGMPKAVVDAGLADEICPIQDIARAIVTAVKR